MIRERTQELVMIRLFTPESGVNEEDDFEKAVDDAKTVKIERREKLVALFTKIADRSTDMKEKLPPQRKAPN
jgi:hypothetical protein